MTQSKDYSVSDAAVGLDVFTFFGYLWVTYLVNACQIFVVAVAVCTWYFSHGSDNKGTAEIGLGFTWTYTKNFGTLCFGSGVLAVVEFIKKMVENARNKKGGN